MGFKRSFREMFFAVVSSIGLLFPRVSCTLLGVFPRDSCQADIDCSSMSLSDCIEATCAACGPKYAVIQECCNAADQDSMFSCLQQGSLDVGNGIATISGTTSGPDMTIAATSPAASPSSSTTTLNPCSAVMSSISYCDLATPGFASMSNFTSQASCLCYRYQSFDAAAFDELFAACAMQSTGSGTVVGRDLGLRTIDAAMTSPCSMAGPVRGYMTASAPAMATVTVVSSGGKELAWNSVHLVLMAVPAVLL